MVSGIRKPAQKPVIKGPATAPKDFNSILRDGELSVAAKQSAIKALAKTKNIKPDAALIKDLLKAATKE